MKLRYSLKFSSHKISTSCSMLAKKKKRPSYLEESVILSVHSNPEELPSPAATEEKPKRKKPTKIVGPSILSISPDDKMLLPDDDPDFIQPNSGNFNSIPRLQHGLERVLFNPGVHYLRDPRTNVYNFDPYLRFIVQPADFDYSRVPAFIPPSQDQVLAKLGDNDPLVKFTGSTSSTSGLLSQIYLLISRFQNVSLDNLPKHYHTMNSEYTKRFRSYKMVSLNPRGNDIYSISAFDPRNKETVLSLMGTSMEYFFTKNRHEFSKLLKSFPIEDLDLLVRSESPDTYAYCKYSGFLLRSQLDCQNPHLPRKCFDVKTRATAAIRYNVNNHEKFLDYRLHQYNGKYNSYSKEYYDMIRSAFLKYQFQVRIGNMDGLFVAYHNTQEIFGFQYVPREEIDDILFGSSNGGDQYFKLSLKMLGEILTTTTQTWAGEYIRLLCSACPDGTMKFFAEKVNDPNNINIDDLEESCLKSWNVVIGKHINGELTETNGPIRPLDKLGISFRIQASEKNSVDEYRKLFSAYVATLDGKKISEENMLKLFSPYFASLDISDPVLLD